MTLVLVWVPQVASAAVAPAAVVGPPGRDGVDGVDGTDGVDGNDCADGIREAAQARADGLTPTALWRVTRSPPVGPWTGCYVTPYICDSRAPISPLWR